MNCASDKAESCVETKNIIFIKPVKTQIFGRQKSLFLLFGSCKSRRPYSLSKIGLIVFSEKAAVGLSARRRCSEKAVSLFCKCGEDLK